jgi:hypothetical protein
MQPPQVMNLRWLGVTHRVDLCVWCWAKRRRAARIRTKDEKSEWQKDAVDGRQALETKTKIAISGYWLWKNMYIENFMLKKFEFNEWNKFTSKNWINKI